MNDTATVLQRYMCDALVFGSSWIRKRSCWNEHVAIKRFHLSRNERLGDSCNPRTPELTGPFVSNPSHFA